MKSVLTLITALMLMCSGYNAAAQSKYPYDQEGMIFDINVETGQFNVGDMLYVIPADTVIHKPSGEKFTGLDLLKPGTPIGYTMKGDVITEVWILDRKPIDITINDD